MKQGILYGVLALIDLIAAAVVAALLPALAPVHFAGGVVDRLGSPWVFISMPAVTAFLSVGVLVLLMKNRGVLALLLASLGGIFSVLGWAFFAYACGGQAVGDAVSFPYAILVLPFAVALMIAGGVFVRSRVRACTFTAGGILSYILGVIFSCALPRLGYIAYMALALACTAAVCVFVRTAKRG